MLLLPNEDLKRKGAEKEKRKRKYRSTKRRDHTIIRLIPVHMGG